jgi:hypothetical protein
MDREKLRNPAVVRTSGELKPETITFKGSPRPPPASSSIVPPWAAGLKKDVPPLSRGLAKLEDACITRVMIHMSLYMSVLEDGMVYVRRNKVFQGGNHPL